MRHGTEGLALWLWGTLQQALLAGNRWSGRVLQISTEMELPVNLHSQYTKTIASGFIGFTLAVILALLPPMAFAQKNQSNPASLVVGTVDVPPFTTKTMAGVWEGLSIDLLDEIASDLNRDYEVREFTDIKSLLQAANAGDIDLVPALAAREEAEMILDLTQPYYRSGFAIAISGVDTGQGWLGVFRALEVSQFFYVTGGLLLLWLLAGVTIWLLERKQNKDMFGGNFIEGMGQGIWWSAVTMTTVGYGDKAPKTPGGRLIAIIWMFTSIVLVSSFTASISASLTAEKLQGKVRGVQDLPHVRVGTVIDSGTLDWLRQHNIPASGFPSAKVGLRAIADGKIDAFVFDEAVLRSITASDFPGLVYVLPESFEHYYVTMGVKNDSPLRESINRATLRFMATDAWTGMLKRHMSVGR